VVLVFLGIGLPESAPGIATKDEGMMGMQYVSHSQQNHAEIEIAWTAGGTNFALGIVSGSGCLVCMSRSFCMQLFLHRHVTFCIGEHYYWSICCIVY
jgi:hypothetical protein